MKRRGGREGGLSRRRFLEQAGAAVGITALVDACGDDGAAESSTVGPPIGGATGTAASGGGAMPPVGGGAVGSGGSAAGASASGGTGAGTSGAPDGGAPMVDDAGGAATGGDLRVAFVKSAGDLDAAVARAVELAGGIDEIRAGDTVFIKPNAVSDRAIGMRGIRTSNEVLAAVVRLVKARKPGRIIVGDRSARGFDSQSVFDASGLGAAALAAGADEVHAAPSPTVDPGAWMLVQPPNYEESWSAAGGILAMRKIVEADHLINVPVMKDHRYALFSLSLKNFVGAIGDASRDPIHYASSGVGDFEPIGRDIALLNQPFSPLINVMDATVALINGGPQGDGADAVRTTPDLVLAGRNRVALDAAAVSFLKLEQSHVTVSMPDAAQNVLRETAPFTFPQIANAATLGLGPAGAEGVVLVFEGVDDATMIESIFRG